MQDVKLYTQNAPQYEGDCEYRISSKSNDHVVDNLFSLNIPSSSKILSGACAGAAARGTTAGAGPAAIVGTGTARAGPAGACCGSGISAHKYMHMSIRYKKIKIIQMCQGSQVKARGHD